MSIYDKVNPHYTLTNLTPALIESIKSLVKYNFENKLDTYLNKVFQKEDANVLVDISLEKNKKWEYNGAFKFFLDGKDFYYSRDSYKNPDDLVNHAFDHLKEHLSKK